MKKILLFASALAGLFLAASCQQENLEPVGGNTVTYTVQVPDALATKALGDDITNVNVLHYEVYRTEVANTETFTEGVDNLLYHKTASMTNGVATISLELVNDQNYTVLFWAQVGETNEAYEVSDLTNVTVKSSLNANQVDYAAFAGVDFIVEGKNLAGRTVTLERPISQINIATTPASLGGNGAFQDAVVLEGSSVTVVGLSRSFNVAKQEPAAAMEAVYEFAEQAVPVETLDVNGVGYTYVAMNYVGFADEVGNNVKVSYVINTTEGDIDNDIENVPVKPNYRTNIVGNLITATSDYTVTLDAEWAGVAKEYEIWDGETLNAPTTNAAGEYMVSKPSEWAYLANQQNPATKANPVPVVINLTSDLDFGGNELTGLVAASNNSLTVKGNGYTIMNAKMVSGNNDNGTPCAALFVSLSSSELTVSDLNVKNVNVVVDQDPKWGYAAVLVAYAEGEVTLNNINVSNSTVYGTHSIGTAVGFIAGYSSVEINNFAADGIKLSNADVAGESGSMGGFAGRVAGKLTAENVKVSNSTIEAYVATASDQKRSIAKFIGNFVGGGEINVTGATVDNVTIVAKNELAETQQCLYTEYLGGWRGNGGTVSINGIEITKDQTNEDITVDTPAELAAAISNAADGAVIPVSGEIATTELKAGDGKSITIVGMSDDATIDVKANNSYTNTSGNITFQNLTIKLNSNPAYHYSVGLHNNSGKHVYDNCKFEGCITAWGDCTYNNCEFVNNTKGKYAAWVYAGTVIYNNCTFSGNDRAAKVFNENPNSGLNVTYNNCTFKSSTPNKTAVEVDVTINTAVATYVEIINPTIENMGVAVHYAVGADGVCNLETSGKGLGIVNLNGKSYSVASTAAQLQALTNAGKDVTIEVLEDISGDFTYTQNKEHDLVIDGAGKTMNGTINITARAGKDALGSLVIKNFNFLTTETARDFIRSVETNYYPNNVTVSNCTFEGPSATSDVVPVTLKSSSNFVMEKCTATGVHSLVQNTSGWNLTIRDSQVTNAGRGISLSSCQGVLVENVKIQASNEKYGIRADGAYANTTTIKNCEISSFIPVVVRNASAAYKLVFDGTNTMTAANTDGYWCVIGTTEYEANGSLPIAATGAVTVTLNDAGLDASGVYGASNL